MSLKVLRAIINALLVVIIILLAMAALDRIVSNSADLPPVSANDESEIGVSQTFETSNILTQSDDIQLIYSALPSPEDYQIRIDDGIRREAQINTIIPSRPRVDVITYTVQTGDSLFIIADMYSLKPETILWGNYEVLEDNPHLLSKDQVLNILPTDGTYYQWQINDSLQQVAAFFGVDVEAILNFPGNHFDLTLAEASNPGIEAGEWLIIPGGQRAIKDWGPPAISRNNPASARYYGEGHCGSIYEGAIGTGTFVWPTPARFLSGYGYSGIHPAVDIAGEIGNAVFATDSGVVVYAGWSNYGYGYLIVIDHGNGWQSAYAHLSAVAVTCGQSVFQGGYIGALGSSGNSSGPHLHFELVFNGAKTNPLDYIQ